MAKTGYRSLKCTLRQAESTGKRKKYLMNKVEKQKKETYLKKTHL